MITGMIIAIDCQVGHSALNSARGNNYELALDDSRRPEPAARPQTRGGAGGATITTWGGPEGDLGAVAARRPGFTVVFNRCLTNKAMLVLRDELNLL